MDEVVERLWRMQCEHPAVLYLPDKRLRMRQSGEATLTYHCQRGPRSSAACTYVREHLPETTRPRQQTHHRLVGCQMSVSLRFPAGHVPDQCLLSGDALTVPGQADAPEHAADTGTQQSVQGVAGDQPQVVVTIQGEHSHHRPGSVEDRNHFPVAQVGTCKPQSLEKMQMAIESNVHICLERWLRWCIWLE